MAINVEDWIGYAKGCAYHYCAGTSLEVDDVCQVAMIGLLRAARDFDPSLSVPFRSYLSIRINGEIRDYMRDCIDPLSRSQRRKINGGHPDAIVPPKFVSLSTPVGDRDGTVELHETLPDPWADDPADSVGLVIEDIDALLIRLPERERLVVSLWLFDDMRQKGIAEVIGVTEARVSQIIARACERLRPFVARPLAA